jgi:outer membrane biosynthesis protein TonB
MLADTIEAAARSLPDPTPEKIDALIHKLVRSKLNDGQLDESELTFSDLEKICSAFSTVLTGVFHERIEYPDVKLPPRIENHAEAASEAPTPEAAKPAPPIEPVPQTVPVPQAVPAAAPEKAAEDAPEAPTAPAAVEAPAEEAASDGD